MRAARVTAVLATVLASGLLACGSLKGADDGDGDGDAGGGSSGTSGSSSGSGDGGPNVDAAGDTGVADPEPSNGNGDPRWVQGKVPGDAPGASDFTIANGVDGALVTDNRTGVTWQDTITGANVTWAGATAYCDALVYSGFSDWRAPTRWEMITVLVIPPSGAGSLAPAAFSLPPGGGSTYAAWTSSVVVSSPSDTVWAVSATGTVQKATEATGPVRCVRDPKGALPAPRAPLYDLSDTSVVRDLTTGLAWERTAPAGDLTLADATARCQALVLQGHAARMPTVKELASLVDETKTQPAVAGAFGNALGRVHTQNASWVVDFSNGNLLAVTSAVARGSRCVSDP